MQEAPPGPHLQRGRCTQTQAKAPQARGQACRGHVGRWRVRGPPETQNSGQTWGTWAWGGSYLQLPTPSQSQGINPAGRPTHKIKPSLGPKVPRRGAEGSRVPGHLSPSKPGARGRQGRGISILLAPSDLGQGIGWHEAPFLAAADPDEAISISASAHTDADLSETARQRDSDAVLSPHPEAC